jgi:hypothetical protein
MAKYFGKMILLEIQSEARKAVKIARIRGKKKVFGVGPWVPPSLPCFGAPHVRPGAYELLSTRRPPHRRRRRRWRRTHRLPGPLGTRNGVHPVRRSFVSPPPGAHEHPVPRDSTIAPLCRSLPRELHAARGRMASRGVNRVSPSFPLPFSFSSLARIPSPSSPVSDPDQVWFLVFVALINYSFYMFRHVNIN